MLLQTNVLRLDRVCTIQSGFTARGRLEPAEHGNVLGLQLRDILPTDKIALEGLTRIQLDSAPDKYLVRSGDVVFRSRGERTTAAVIDDAFSGEALAVLPLMILRPNTNLLTGAYLAWAINQGPTQRFLLEKSQGTNLRMVSRAALEELEIAVPELDVQAQILNIDALAENERELAEQITLKRHELIHRVLVERAQGHTATGGRKRIPQ
jgi:hypothetical protein